MRTTLAAAVVFDCALMGYAQAGSPTQEPTPTQQSQPEQTSSPATSQPQQEAPVPETQQPSTTPPAQEAEPQPAPAQPQAQPEVSQPETSKKPAASTTKPKTKKHKAKKTVPPSSTPTKKVVRNGGTSEPEVQLSPRLSAKQQADQKQKISNLLSQTDATLQKVAGRQLKASEEEMVKQIRVYMDQAKQATDAGDLQRAQNLASKAHLLSDELVHK